MTFVELQDKAIKAERIAGYFWCKRVGHADKWLASEHARKSGEYGRATHNARMSMTNREQ